jgi:hypothetical protein
MDVWQGKYMRAIWKVTSSELLTKQAIRKKIIIYKNIEGLDKIMETLEIPYTFLY